MKKQYINALLFVSVADLSAGTCPVGTAQEKTVLVREVPLNNENQACPTPTDGSPIDVTLLSGSTTKIVSFTLRNNEATTQNVIFGTEAGFEGTNTRYNLPASAVDANVQDEFGNHLQKVQGFNALVCNHSAIISKIEVFVQNATQRAQRFTKVVLDLDANLCDTKGRIPVSDTQVNAVIMNGIYIVSDRLGLQYPLRPFADIAEDTEVQFTILSEALIETFQKGESK